MYTTDFNFFIKDHDSVDKMQSNVKLQRKLFDVIRKEDVLNTIYFILIYLSIPLMILLILIIILLRQIVHYLLKWKYQQLFGGLLESADAVWAIEDNSRMIINTLVFVKINDPESVIEKIKNNFQEKIFKQGQSHRLIKLTGVRRRCLGFTFILKNQLTVDDCISTMKFENNKSYLTERELQELISEYSNQPLPKENSALWELLVSPKPIYLESTKELTCSYPILFRMHHIVADGYSITHFFLRMFANDTSISALRDTQNMITRSYSHILTNIGVLSKLKHALKLLEVMLKVPSVILYKNLLRKEDVNSLHGCQLSGDKILVYAIEKERNFLSLFKKIKENVPNSRFSDVLLSAISGSFENYFMTNAQCIPEFITICVPALLGLPNLDAEPQLENRFSLGTVNLPILIKTDSMTDRLQKVIKETDKLRNSVEYQVNYLVLTLLSGILPYPILQYFVKYYMYTVTISSLPGFQKCTVLDDYEVNDILFFVPHRRTLGVGFSALTYDGRFQLGLTVDKSLISSVDVAQQIVDDVFRYINLLAQEVVPCNSRS